MGKRLFPLSKTQVPEMQRRGEFHLPTDDDYDSDTWFSVQN